MGISLEVSSIFNLSNYYSALAAPNRYPDTRRAITIAKLLQACRIQQAADVYSAPAAPSWREFEDWLCRRLSIEQNRDAARARQLWESLLYYPKTTADLRELIEQSLDILTKESNSQDPRNYTEYGQSDAQKLSDHYRDLAIGFAFAGAIFMGIANFPPTEYTCDDRPPEGCNFKLK